MSVEFVFLMFYTLLFTLFDCFQLCVVEQDEEEDITGTDAWPPLVTSLVAKGSNTTTKGSGLFLPSSACVSCADSRRMECFWKLLAANVPSAHIMLFGVQDALLALDFVFYIKSSSFISILAVVIETHECVSRQIYSSFFLGLDVCFKQYSQFDRSFD